VIPSAAPAATTAATSQSRPAPPAQRLGFFASADAAKNALSAYQSVGDITDAPSDVFARRGNVTLAWDHSPTSRERSLVESVRGLKYLQIGLFCCLI